MRDDGLGVGMGGGGLILAGHGRGATYRAVLTSVNLQALRGKGVIRVLNIH